AQSDCDTRIAPHSLHRHSRQVGVSVIRSSTMCSWIIARPRSPVTSGNRFASIERDETEQPPRLYEQPISVIAVSAMLVFGSFADHLLITSSLGVMAGTGIKIFTARLAVVATLLPLRERYLAALAVVTVGFLRE